MAGILCQVGMTFSMPPRREGCEIEDLRCFFQVCREVWPSTCLGAELFVDCGVDISACEVSKVKGENREALFLFVRGVGRLPATRRYELTGEIANVPWDEVDEQRGCYGFLHRSNWGVGRLAELVPIPVCRVIGFGRPREVRPEESKTEELAAPVGRREVRGARMCAEREQVFACSLS